MSMMQQTGGRPTAGVWGIVLVASLAALPYLNSLNGDWTYDDKVAVLGNPDVLQHNIPIADLFVHDFWGNQMRMWWPAWLGGSNNATESIWTHSSYRPLTVLTFRFNHYLHELDVFGYHALSVAIHAVAAVGALQTACLLLGRQRWVQAYCVGALFAVHPIHTEVVANTTGRAEVLGGVFVFWAMAAYLWFTSRVSEARLGSAGPPVYAERPPSNLAVVSAMLVSWVLLILGTLCKETTLVVPTILFSFELLVNTPTLESGAKPAPTSDSESSGWFSNLGRFVVGLLRRGHWRRAIAMLVFQVALLYVRVVCISSGYTLHTSILHNPLAVIDDVLIRRLSLGYVQALAMSMLFAPIYLSHEHNALAAVTGLSDPKLLLLGSVWALLIFSFIVIFKRCGDDQVSDIDALSGRCSSHHPGRRTVPSSEAANRRTRILSALAVIIVAYAPASHTLVAVAFVLAERSLFVPSFGAAILLTEAVFALVAWLYTTESQPSEREEDVKQPKSEAGSEPSEPHGISSGLRRRNVSSQSAQAKEADSSSAQSWRDSTGTAKPAPPSVSKCPGYRTALGFLGIVVVAYFARTVRRNMDWANETSLLTSNLDLYPERNPMSLYGLGAAAMYREDLETAKDLLQRAVDARPEGAVFAEPYILLSQIAWGHKLSPDWASEAIFYLEKLREMDSAKREFFTNLGLLKYHQDSSSVENVKEAEYLILLAAAAPAIGPNNPGIGVVNNNAGCFRILSPSDRYGHADLAISHFQKAVQSTHPAARRIAYSNLALYEMLSGRFDEAVSLLEAAYVVSLDDTDKTVAVDLERLHQFANVAAEKEALIRSWGGSNFRPVGVAARERMNELNEFCKTMLLWL